MDKGVGIDLGGEGRAVRKLPNMMNDEDSPYPRMLSSSELMAAFTALTTSPVSTTARKKLQQDILGS